MMILLLAFLLVFIGFTFLSLGMNKHGNLLAGRQLTQSQVYIVQALGTGVLVIALVICMAQWQASVGAALWLGLITFAAMALGTLFTYCSRRSLLLLLGVTVFSAGFLLLLYLLKIFGS